MIRTDQGTKCSTMHRLEQRHGELNDEAIIIYVVKTASSQFQIITDICDRPILESLSR